jgi:hypothetical protein
MFLVKLHPRASMTQTKGQCLQERVTLKSPVDMNDGLCFSKPLNKWEANPWAADVLAPWVTSALAIYKYSQSKSEFQQLIFTRQNMEEVLVLHKGEGRSWILFTLIKFIHLQGS